MLLSEMLPLILYLDFLTRLYRNVFVQGTFNDNKLCIVLFLVFKDCVWINVQASLILKSVLHQILCKCLGILPYYQIWFSANCLVLKFQMKKKKFYFPDVSCLLWVCSSLLLATSLEIENLRLLPRDKWHQNLYLVSWWI